MWTQQETRWLDVGEWDACRTKNAEQLRAGLEVLVNDRVALRSISLVRRDDAKRL